MLHSAAMRKPWSHMEICCSSGQTPRGGRLLIAGHRGNCRQDGSETRWWIEPLGSDLFLIDSGGIYRTANRGRSWTACGAVPRTGRGDDRLIAAGHSLLYWLPKAGLFRSQDRCATWASVRIPWNADPGSVGFVLAKDAGLVFIHTSRGWFRTTDEGHSWNSVNGPAARPLPSASNGQSAIVFGTDLVVGTTNGVFRSTDRGLSWSQIGFPGRWARTAVTRDGVIYAALDGGESARVRTAVTRSSDGGRTWLPADDGLSGHYIHDVRRDESGLVYAAGDAGVYRLEDSGRWQHIGLPRSFAHVPVCGAVGRSLPGNRARCCIPVAGSGRELASAAAAAQTGQLHDGHEAG